MTNNILILCHGITPKLEPCNHDHEYDAFLNQLFSLNPDLKEQFGCILKIEYGHEPPELSGRDCREDEKLTRAQTFIRQSISYKTILSSPTEEDQIFASRTQMISTALGRVTNPIRDTFFALGLTDALYYASEDGEKAIRYAVYSQILKALDGCETKGETRLHIVAHSLGVTIMFDFLYGLFAHSNNYAHNDGLPDFVKTFQNQHSQEHHDAATRYHYWRNQTQSQNQKGKLKLASFVNLGGQLPFFLMRKQKLINHFAEQKRLNPENIGVPKSGKPVWKIFYDQDDILGYPVRGLFETSGSIRQYQVNTGFMPHKAHNSYWGNPKVLQESGKLIKSNANPQKSIGLFSE